MDARRMLIGMAMLFALPCGLLVASRAILLLKPAPVTWQWCTTVPYSSDDLSNATQSNNSLRTSDGITRILKRLQRPAPCIDSTETLGSIVNLLPVPAIIDERALEEENVFVDEKIRTLPFAGQTAQSYLDMILDPLNLTWVPREDHIVVTSRRSSANVVCLYDVTGIPASYALLKKGQWPSTTQNYTSLVGTIEMSIDADSWQNVGGTSTIAVWNVQDQHILVISAPLDTHVKVQTFFQSFDHLCSAR